MLTPTQLSQLIEQEITQLDLKGKPDNLYEPMRYIVSLGGKRTRPQLVVLGCELFTDSVQPALTAAMAVECFHNFTLLHDDIMDIAPLRRGKATVHEKWNTNIAILSGDALFVKSIQLLMQVPNAVLVPCLTTFNATALQVCEGQQLDMNFETQATVSIPQYINMIRLKTAVLLGASLKIGAYIGGAVAEDAEALYKFGEYLGIAFQLQDDILDVYGNPETFGKQVGGDILANKKTYLLLKSLQVAHKYQLEVLQQWTQTIDYNPTEKIKAITEIYDYLNVRKLAEAEMEMYYTKALQCLATIPVSDERKQSLLQLAAQLMLRTQ
ncbi:MAG: polyprenyl synthetase family protein [Bacteroidia bacterium]|jgi:geranylgeranyl diphosphate synthase, type II